MDWIVKLQSHGGQYRITLPGDLIVKAGLENARQVWLESYNEGEILIKGYYGKSKEERDLPEDRS